MAGSEREGTQEPHDVVAAWHREWLGWNFAWDLEGEHQWLESRTLTPPPGFPRADEEAGCEGQIRLRDFWRWSAGVGGESRLMTDEELIAAGLLVTVEGKRYHLIHAPDMSLKTDSEGKPLQILIDILSARTDAGGVKGTELMLDGAWIPGKLLQMLDLSDGVSLFCAHISAACFSGTFRGTLYGHFTLFSGETQFSGTVFESELKLETCIFAGPAHFARTSYHSDVTFSGSKFIDRADFFEADFIKRVSFTSARFSGLACFSRACFGAETKFYNVRFGGWAAFDTALFNEAAEFSYAELCQGGKFDGAVFKGFMLFRQTRFMAEVTFSDISYHPVNSLRHPVWDVDPQIGSGSFKADEPFNQNAISWQVTRWRR